MKYTEKDLIEKGSCETWRCSVCEIYNEKNRECGAVKYCLENNLPFVAGTEASRIYVENYLREKGKEKMSEIKKCTNKDCPCGLWSLHTKNNCDHYDEKSMEVCPAYKPEEKKKRLITPIELFERGATFLKCNKTNIIAMITHFQYDAIETEYNHYRDFNELVKKDVLWTSDRKTWNSFEVEE